MISRRHDFSTHLVEKAGLPVDRYPSTADEIERAENAIVHALDELSIEEQEKIIFDVHGFATVSELDEEVISTLMKRLEEEIEKIPSKEAYELAKVHDLGFVTRHNFRMMFLRACDYDPAMTATMIVDHFEKKRELFGEKVLGREIYQSDLSENELAFIRDGCAQLLPTRDAAGRCVLAFNSNRDSFLKQKKVIHRPMFYFYMALLRDKEVAENRVIAISYIHNSREYDLETFKVILEMENVLPLRDAGGHICACPDSSIRGMVAGMKLLSRNSRYRNRTHFGSIDENHFKLLTYGIPVNDSPMKSDGTWSTDFHVQWMENIRLQEEEARQKLGGSPTELIVAPRKYDVLCGKSQRAKTSCGTQRALHLVDMHRDVYESRNKKDKTIVATEILSLIHESGGRFLKEGKQRGTWEEMDDLSARQKIAHWFRHLRFKENLTTSRGNDATDNLDKSTHDRKLSDDDSERPSSSSVVRRDEAGGPNKRPAPSVDAFDPIYDCDGMFSIDSLFGSDGAWYEFDDDAL